MVGQRITDEWILFEDPLMASYARHFTADSPKIFSVKQFLEIQTGERVKPPRNSTVLELRRALVFSESDVDFAFSHLSKTPRTENLKEDLKQALREDSNDEAALLWNFIERAKAFSLESLPRRIQFVRAIPSEQWFTELIQSLAAYPGMEIEEVASSQLFPSQGYRRPHIYFADTFPLVSLSRHLKDRLRNSSSRAELFIQLDSANTLLLKMALKNSGLDFVSPLDEVIVSPPSAIFDRIRRCHAYPLKERLTLIHHLLKFAQDHHLENLEWPTDISIPLSDYQKEILNTTRKLPLLDEEKPKPLQSISVQIFPLSLLNLSTAPIQMAFVDSSLQEMRKSSLLTPPEIQKLFNAGFPLLREEDYQKAYHETLLEWSTKLSPHRDLFLGIPPELCGLSKYRPLRAWNAYTKGPQFFTVSESNPPAEFSAAQLETYQRCPRQYYFRYIIKLKSDTSLDEQWALTVGKLTHRVLHLAFEPELQTGKSSMETFSKKLPEFLKTARQEIVPTLSEIKNTWKLLEMEVQQLVNRIPNLEQNLVEFVGECQTIALETPFLISYADHSFRGKMDRVVRLKDEKILIIDYKTGAVDFSPNHIRAGSHFQIPLYYQAVQEMFRAPLAGTLYYELRSGELSRGIIDSSVVKENRQKQLVRGHAMTESSLQELKEQSLKHTKALLEEMHKGEFIPLPNRNKCSACPYQGVCPEGLKSAA